MRAENMISLEFPIKIKPATKETMPIEKTCIIYIHIALNQEFKFKKSQINVTGAHKNIPIIGYASSIITT